jgi:putative hydroxymethylpyrimidine transport system permease protein
MSVVRGIGRRLAVAAGLLGFWQVLVWLTAAPPWILPGPLQVLAAAVQRWESIAGHAATTVTEIVLGLVIGTVVGAASAVSLVQYQGLRRWLLPVLVVSQALPVFALAPLLVLWLGYGLASKVAMAVLIIYFPVTAACYDGLRHTEPGWIDLARTLGGSPWAIMCHVRAPAALPAFASGLRVATAVAPIGAVVGEWVGSSSGLGYLMLHANARMQVDLMFAALLALAMFALGLWFAVDALLRRLVFWQTDSSTLPHKD